MGKLMSSNGVYASRAENGIQMPDKYPCGPHAPSLADGTGLALLQPYPLRVRVQNMCVPREICAYILQK